MLAMNNILRALVVTVVTLTTAACGFSLRDSYNLPEEVTKVSLTSFDPYGELTREMQTQLRFHDIDVVRASPDTTNIHLISESDRKSTLSLYQNSRVAEKEFRYQASYRVTVPEKGSYVFSTSVSRNFLDNPLTALAKSVEQDKLIEEMRVEATRQIMRQLSRMTSHIEDFERRQAEAEEFKRLQQQELQGKPGLTIETRVEESSSN